MPFRYSDLTTAFTHCCFIFVVFAGVGVAFTAEVSRPVADDGPTRVRLLIGVIDVDKIDSANQSFTANIFFEACWHDPRSAHEGSGEISHPLDDVWHPRLQIVNQQRIVKTLPDIVEVRPNGDATYRQRLWGTFSQRLDVRDFPCDRQVFRVRVAAAGYSPREVQFDQEFESGPKVLSELSVTDWRISDWKQMPQTFKSVGFGDLAPGYELSFKAERQVRFHVSKTILPLVLIVAMSWTVFWISPAQTGPQISVATTSMLTLIAYRFMVGGRLPNVSYLTRMDHFILGSMMLVFLTLVQAVTTSVLAESGRTALAKKIDRWCRWIFPFGFVAVCILAFFV